MRNEDYSLIDKKIDDYLGTRNLRPGPPARLINKILDGADKTDPTEDQRINFSSFAVKIERDIPWTELSAVKMSTYGSEPAFFLEFLNNKILILKDPPEIPLYYFGSLIATGLGVKTPKTRIVEYKDPEFPIMLDNLERASHADVGINNKIIHEVRAKPFVILYEYIPSLSLFELGNNRSQVLLKEKNFKSRELFINIGKILGLDIFLNNSKRLPFVWLNNGDPNNIFFKVIMNLVSPGANFKDQKVIEIYLQDVYCMDTLPCVLDPNDKVMLKNLGDYLNSLGEFFKMMCYEFKSICLYGKDIESFQFRSFDKLIAMFKNTTEYTLTPTNLFHICMGILIMINTILDIDMDSFDKLIKYATKDAISKDWADTYKQYAQTIKNEYFIYMMEFFKKIKDDNDQIFSWIEEITFGIYQCNASEEILKVVKKHKKYRYDYEELKKKKEEEEASNISRSKSKRKTKVGDLEQKTEKSGESDQQNTKSIILERDGFGPLGPQHKGKKNIRDFFNFNKDDKAIFKNDVHNGVYDLADLDDMIIELRDRKYNKIGDKPPKPDDLDDENAKRKKKKGKDDSDLNNNDNYKPYNDYDPEHKVLTREELKNKIQKEELYGILQTKKKFNPEEGKYLGEKIDEVDSEFEKKIEKDLKAEKEKDEKLKENSIEFNNIPPKGRKSLRVEEDSMKKSVASKKSEVKKSEEEKKSQNKKSENKKSENKKSENKKSENKKSENKKSEVKNTQESKKSKKGKKEEEDEDEEEEEEEDDEE